MKIKKLIFDNTPKNIKSKMWSLGLTQVISDYFC